MRISFSGYDETADLVLTPPDDISYRVPIGQRQVTTTSRSYRLRRLASATGLQIELSWDAIPENELAALALLPSDEVHELVLESATYQGVFSEPERAMTPYVTWDDQPTYRARVTFYTVNEYALGEVKQVSPLSRRVLGATTFLNQATRNYPPAEPSPAYTPIVPEAWNGLPPGVSHLEGFRWTFAEVDTTTGVLRFFDESSEDWLEVSGTQQYRDWFSVFSGNLTSRASLRRGWFNLDTMWSLGMLLYRDRTLGNGPLLEVWDNGNYLYLHNTGDTLNVQYILAGGTGYTESFTLTGGYDYLWLQYDDGTFRCGFNGVVKTVPAIAAPAIAAEVKFLLGGGGVLVDDLVLVNGVQVDMEQVRSWLLGL
ncbi:hypothetical protein phiFa_74 [Thermus phage phiFa]|nr:hypothetical protein phiFa_74 [Thermus phage phiFa]